jgi:predicted metal-dependent hydrolase
MHVRAPDIAPDEGPLVWSKVAEFSLAYKGYSVVIPYVEYYLNAVISKVRRQYGSKNEALNRDLTVFLKQETNHSQYHVRFNQRMFDAGIAGLEARAPHSRCCGRTRRSLSVCRSARHSRRQLRPVHQIGRAPEDFVKHARIQADSTRDSAFHMLAYQQTH